MEFEVLIPFLKKDSFLFISLDSLKNQVKQALRLILVGPKNLPKQDRFEILDLCNSLGFKTKLLLSSSGNVAGALNTGLRETNSEVVIRMDADDVVLPGRIQSQLDYLSLHPEVIVVGGQISLISARGIPLLWPRVHYPTDPVKLRTKMLDGCFMAHPAVAMRTETILSLGGYREWFDSAEDYDLWLRVLKVGQLANLEQKVIKYRQHKNQASKKSFDVSKFSLAALNSYLGKNGDLIY
jgi:glycosyltransferase involved in cell wall biosynthesis